MCSVLSQAMALSLAQAQAQAQVQHEDYPALAMRMHHEGVVRYRVEYGKDGALVACTITGSSGYPELDAQTCLLLKRWSHAQPQPPGAKDGSISWRLPQ